MRDGGGRWEVTVDKWVREELGHGWQDEELSNDRLRI
jgi:hypothetical protein